MYIDDTPGLTIAALRTRARRLKRQKNVGLIVVDYLQLLQGTGRNSNDNRVNEISEISRGLKQLAKELDVPVIALSQLSRAVEQREDKRPQLSDLRESGSIEQDADMVLFIYREDYYLGNKQPPDDHPDFPKWKEDMERAYGTAEVIVAKQRHGSTGKVRLKFESRITRFSDLVDDNRLARPARLISGPVGDGGVGWSGAPFACRRSSSRDCPASGAALASADRWRQGVGRMRGVVAFVAAGLMAAAASAGGAGRRDPYIWLETIKGPKVDAWVEAENKKTAAALESDPRFKKAYDDAFAVLSAKDRIPTAAFRGGTLDNFWQDANHEKGILRTTTLASYQTAEPAMADADRLRRFVEGGRQELGLQGPDLPPARRALLPRRRLSDGGRDAVEVREFDRVEGKFVAGGFTLPEGRNFVDWIDRDHWLVVARLGRGDDDPVQSIRSSSSAWRAASPCRRPRKCIRGKPSDIAVFPAVLRDTDGKVTPSSRSATSPPSRPQYALLGDGEPKVLDLPAKASLLGSIGDRMLVQIDEAWSRGGTQYPGQFDPVVRPCCLEARSQCRAPRRWCGRPGPSSRSTAPA